jgi:hypothetical protein
MFHAWIANFLSTTVESSCEKERDEKKRKTGEKKTEEESPGLKRHTRCTPCGASPPPPTSPTYQGRSKRYMTASKWRSGVEKLLSDIDGDHFLRLPLFDRTVRQFFSGSTYFSCCANISVGAKDFGCAKFLASPKDSGCAKFLASAKDFGCANVFVSVEFLDAPMFCIYFAVPIFLYIFLHSYLVCANNLTGSNVLRLVG